MGIFERFFKNRQKKTKDNISVDSYFESCMDTFFGEN